jgi:dienelactone hydrolase
MDAGFALSERPVERVRIPYEGTTLPGYLFHPDASGRPRPLLIMVNGSDGSVLDLWVLGAAEGVARGYACLAVDGPGQGAALFEQNLFFRPDWEKVITPVVDFALARADVDPRRIAIQGISQGGYWVPRALAFEHRIAAAVADPGVVDVSTTWFAHLPPAVLALLDGGQKRMFNDLMNADPAHAATLAFRARPYGFSSPYDLYAAVRRYTLAGITERITTPMLITDPDEEQFWPGQPQQLYAALRGPKELVRFTVAEGGEAHCEPLAPRLRAQRIFDWLDATL